MKIGLIGPMLIWKTCMKIERYGIYLVNLDPTVGSEIKKTRPVIVVSDNGMNKLLSTVVACPLTTSIHENWRSRVQLICAGKEAEIAVDQIRCLSKQRFMKRIDKAPDNTAEMLRITISEMYAE